MTENVLEEGNPHSNGDAMTQSSDRFRPQTAIGIDAVAQALEVAACGVDPQAIMAKGERDVVTATDIVIEDLIRRVVGASSPVPVVGEERGGEVPASGSPCWLLDPLCGTRNFASGIPLYCVNLAFLEGGQVTAAVVGDPSTGEIHVAEVGRGVWVVKNGERRRLMSSDGSRIINIEDSHAQGTRREQAAQFAALVIQADRWEFRSLSTTLALPYIAAGRIAAYVSFWMSAVHGAAGSLLATEAGASLSDIDGRPWTVTSDSIVASANSKLHGYLLDLARDALARTSLSTGHEVPLHLDRLT